VQSFRNGRLRRGRADLSHIISLQTEKRAMMKDLGPRKSSTEKRTWRKRGRPMSMDSSRRFRRPGGKRRIHIFRAEKQARSKMEKMKGGFFFFGKRPSKGREEHRAQKKGSTGREGARKKAQNKREQKRTQKKRSRQAGKNPEERKPPGKGRRTPKDRREARKSSLAGMELL